MTKEQKDYSNTLTNAADKIGSSVEEVLTNGFTNVWEIFKILHNDFFFTTIYLVNIYYYKR